MNPSSSSARNSKRFSFCTPSVAVSASSISTNGDSRIRDIKRWSQGLDRLDSVKLQSQRYAPSAQKSDQLDKVALEAKVDRALGRRLTDQDATMREKRLPNDKVELRSS